jgi:Plavaka transposase
LSLILYSDATTTDTLGKSSLHPIYISLGNIPTWRRNKEDAKQLLGYFPILFAKDETEKRSSGFKKLVRETFHKSLKFLLDPLFENKNGIEFKVSDENIWFYPKVSIIIGDWPEACTYSLTYKSANSNFPCHFCLVQKDNLINTRQDQVILRNHENMIEYFNNGTGNLASLEQVDNYFWNIP